MSVSGASMRYVTNIGTTCIKSVLAALMILELAVCFVADFSNYQFDRFVLFVAAAMSLLCLLRLSKS